MALQRAFIWTEWILVAIEWMAKVVQDYPHVLSQEITGYEETGRFVWVVEGETPKHLQQIRPTRTVETEVTGLAQLNHYYTRSFEEFEAKRQRGSATGRIARPAVPFDLPTLETDASASRYSERTTATIERLRSLEPRPYAYGSQLADQVVRLLAQHGCDGEHAGTDSQSRIVAVRPESVDDSLPALLQRGAGIP